MKNNKRKCIEDPFIIIYDHRRAKKLKKLRDLRKLKIQHIKQLQKHAIQLQKQQTSHFLNRSMLLEEEDWNQAILKNPYSDTSSPQDNFGFEEKQKKLVKTLCWQVLCAIPSVVKRQVFNQSFEPFEYMGTQQQKSSVTK